MMTRLLIVTLIICAISGCKLQLLPGKNSLIRGERYWCLPTERCNIQVSTTDFTDTYVAEGTDDAWIFSHWQSGDKLLCGNSPSPCRLSTEGFEKNPQLLAILESSQVFKIKPALYQDINTHYPQATPVNLEHDTYLSGTWMPNKANGIRDTWVFVAHSDGAININLHGMKDDLDLAVFEPDPSNPLHQTAIPDWTSSNPGTQDEEFQFSVKAGNAYFVQVTPGNEDVQEAKYSIHLEVISESSKIRPPGSIARNYKLEIATSSSSCSDGGSLQHPLLTAPDWTLASDAKRKNRKQEISLDDGRVAALVFAATRYDRVSGTYVDRASYTLTDGSGVTIHWLAAGAFSENAFFKGSEWSWMSVPSSGVSCASTAAITGS